MNESWNNSRRYLNGHVKPPIVLHSDAEMFVAQNAHNLVWERNRKDYDALVREIKALKDSGADYSEASGRWDAMHASAKQEIDKLIADEIIAYRNDRASNPFLHIEERLDQIEGMVDEIRGIAEDAQSTAEEALDMAASSDSD